MLKAVQCDGCGYAFTVAKLAEQQQVACPSCNSIMNIPSSGIDKNTIIGNRYQIKEIFEESPVCTLYMAMDLDYEDLVLLRVYSWGFSSGVSNIEDFLHTITSVSHLAEPVHVRIIDQGVDDGQIFTVWPYEDTESIDSIIKRSGPMSPAMAVSICKDLALSLDKAFHSTGAGHYNLSPKCIYMNSQGAVKYSDYGISANLSSDQRFIQSGFPLWNMHYLSPEMALGWSYPDIKSDMYALASVLFYMVTGTEPYAGARSVQEINHESLQFPSNVHRDLSRSFEDFFYSMSARNPIQRFTSWSEAVSKMDQFLFEEKSQKKEVSQRQRASLTKVHQQESFDSVRLNPNDRKKKLRSSKSHGLSQKRMSAEDVRKKLANKGDDRPVVSFAKNSPGNRTAVPGVSGKSVRMKAGTGSRNKSTIGAPGSMSRAPRHMGSSGTRAILNSTGSNAPVQHKKQAPAPPKKSKTTGVLIFLGIVFGLMVIGFIIYAALGKETKPKLAEDPNGAEKVEKKDQPETEKENKDDEADVPDSGDKDDSANKEEKNTPDSGDKDEAVKSPIENDPDRLKELLGLIRKGVADRGSDAVKLQAYFDEAYPMADSVAGAKEQLDIYFEEYKPRRELAKRLAYNEIFQQVRNEEFKKEFDAAEAIVNNYTGPFAEELELDLQALKEKIKQNRLKAAQPPDPDPEMKKEEEPKTEEENKEEAKEDSGEAVTLEELAQKIANAQTSIALILFDKCQQQFQDQIGNLGTLKPMIENGEEAKINEKILEGFKKLVDQQVNLINKGQKLTGRLKAVDDEAKEIIVSVNFNGRNLNRIVKLDDLDITNKLPLIVGSNETETAFLKTIYMVRANDLVGALKHFDNYNGPIKKEIKKSLLDNLNSDAVSALMKVLELVGIQDITNDAFHKQIKSITVNKEDGWLSAYLLNKFKVNYSSTKYYSDNEARINELSKILNRIASLAKAPSIIVSEEGLNGTQTLENALREAKSGEVIRILPGVYEGSLELRQRSVSVYGASGVVVNSGLRISESRCLIKQITFTNGNVTLSNEASSVDIVNCMFTKDGINFAGDNSGISIINSIIYGIQIGDNKRTKIDHCTILERKEKNANNSFTIKGYINGEVKNSIIMAEKNYAIRFNESAKSSCVYKHSLIFAGNALAMIGNERITDLNTFKKEVARISNVITDKPEFVEPVAGDYRLKDFSPGFLAGENKKSMGVQMDLALKLIDVQ